MSHLDLYARGVEASSRGNPQAMFQENGDPRFGIGLQKGFCFCGSCFFVGRSGRAPTRDVTILSVERFSEARGVKFPHFGMLAKVQGNA